MLVFVNILLCLDYDIKDEKNNKSVYIQKVLGWWLSPIAALKLSFNRSGGARIEFKAPGQIVRTTNYPQLNGYRNGTACVRYVWTINHAPRYILSKR